MAMPHSCFIASLIGLREWLSIYFRSIRTANLPFLPEALKSVLRVVGKPVVFCIFVTSICDRKQRSENE